jgi:hypothetical protein
MKAVITGIESGSKFIDKEMRVMLKVMEADSVYSEIRLRVSALGLNAAGSGPFLDQEVEVTLSVPKVTRK